MQEIQNQIKTNRVGNPNWVKGVSGNPNGRPANPEKRQLQNALRAAAKENGNKEFLHHIAELAYTDKQVALAVLDKLVPNNQLPKDEDLGSGIKQLIIIRPEGTQDMARPIRVQSEDVSGDVERMGNGQNDVLNISGHVIQRANPEQPGSDISQGVRGPSEVHNG